MKYEVFLSADAEGDLLDIWKYVANHDSSESANRLFDNLQEMCLSLEPFPDRGHYPPELERNTCAGVSENSFQALQDYLSNA